MKKNKIILSALIGTSLLVSGCSTINPYTGEEQQSKATTGSIIGGVAGAVIGVASSSKKDRTKGALIGAIAGAGIGGGIGYQMDVQEAKLRQELKGTGVSVSRVGEQIILNMPNSLTFAVNGKELNSFAYKTLDSVVKVATEFKQTKLNIIGHTDSTGSKSYNQSLSEVRAYKVMQYLGRSLPGNRLHAVGMGPQQPLASNDTKAGRAQNRRVEIILSPLS
ncbi:OmpA family protein [Paraferrimonas sp. SM1919]|uniref:OmpA family protein n=1 Tax=Paraferrimonas sp. SM1919 TaxID=2662263 RepID=UPI001969BB30|nr:OmpA family protein [Paraferrimonas sp. SM1919]